MDETKTISSSVATFDKNQYRSVTVQVKMDLICSKDDNLRYSYGLRLTKKSSILPPFMPDSILEKRKGKMIVSHPDSVSSDVDKQYNK